MSNTQYTVRLAASPDQQKWDTYVASHSAASPYHLFAWKQAIEEAYGHKSYYLLAEKDGEVAGVLPIVHFRLPLLLNEFNSLPFCDVGNILGDNEEVSNLLFNKCLKLCSEKRIKKIHLRGKISESAGKITAFTPEHHNKVRMFLDLPESSEALMKGFKSKLRSQIRKAEKNGLIFSWGSNADIDGYYAVFSENMRDLGSPVHSKGWFQSIFKYYADNARMGIVSYKEEIVGGCILLSAGETIAIPWASTLRKYNRLAPNMLLYWNVLKYSTDAGFARFDFGRSSEGEGTYKFKKQWGAEPTPLVWYNYTASSRPAEKSGNRSGANSKEKIALMWSKIPTPVANFLGPKIRKYISL